MAFPWHPFRLCPSPSAIRGGEERRKRRALPPPPTRRHHFRDSCRREAAPSQPDIWAPKCHSSSLSSHSCPWQRVAVDRLPSLRPPSRPAAPIHTPFERCLHTVPRGLRQRACGCEEAHGSTHNAGMGVEGRLLVSCPSPSIKACGWHSRVAHMLLHPPGPAGCRVHTWRPLSRAPGGWPHTSVGLVTNADSQPS